MIEKKCEEQSISELIATCHDKGICDTSKLNREQLIDKCCNTKQFIIRGYTRSEFEGKVNAEITKQITENGSKTPSIKIDDLVDIRKKVFPKKECLAHEDVCNCDRNTTHLISNYRIKNIPACVKEFRLVKMIDFSRSDIKVIENLEGLDNLEILNLGDTDLGGVEYLNWKYIDTLEESEQLKKIKEWEATKKIKMGKIIGVDTLSTLPRLKELILESNYAIENIDDIKNLSNLETLNLSGNTIKDFHGFTGLPKLNKVDLSSNKIVKIDNVSGLDTLEELKISNNGLQSIVSLSSLKSLKRLFLQGSKDIQGHLHDLKFLNGVNNLEIVDASNNELQDIAELGQLKKLQDVDISKNNIKSINALNDLPELSNINAINNNIPDFSSLSGNTQLKSIHLDANEITTIPDLSKLKRLTSLSLYNNKISKIPVIKNTRLKNLNLDYNNIDKIEGISALKNLENLSISSNKIKKMEGLSTLENLRELELRQNPITEINDISNLVKLQEINLDDTDIDTLNLSALPPYNREHGEELAFKTLKLAFSLIDEDKYREQIDELKRNGVDVYVNKRMTIHHNYR